MSKLIKTDEDQFQKAILVNTENGLYENGIKKVRIESIATTILSRKN